jgi:hypothetical protein
VASKSYSGQVVEARGIRRNDFALGRASRRRDDQVVSAARPPLSMGRDQQLRMCSGHALVVGHRGDRFEHIVHECLALGSGSSRRQLDPDEQFGERDGGDHSVVVVVDQGVELGLGAFGVDEEGRVEEQATQ